VWHDGQLADRADMIAALGAMPSDYARNVVVIQPHASQSAIEAARKSATGSDALRLKQLDTLLVGAAGACRNVSASLVLVGDAQRAAAGSPVRRLTP
jgi:hypothetical protein